MSEPLQVVCPHCHTTNRVPSARLADGVSVACGTSALVQPSSLLTVSPKPTAVSRSPWTTKVRPGMRKAAQPGEQPIPVGMRREAAYGVALRAHRARLAQRRPNWVKVTR